MQLQLFTDNSEANFIYYLLLQPDVAMSFKVSRLRKFAGSILDIHFSSRFRPHITLLQFPMFEKKEIFLVNLLKTYLPNMNVSTFLNTNGLKIFSKQVVISIVNQTNTQEFVNNLEKELFLAGLISNKKKSYFKARNLHISVSDKFSLRTTEEIHKVLLSHFIDSEFSCNNLTLLKSKTGIAPWTTVNSFALAN